MKLQAELAGSIDLRIVDSDGKTDMINPSPFRFPHRVSITTGAETVAFFVCSEVVGVAMAGLVPRQAALRRVPAPSPYGFHKDAQN